MQGSSIGILRATVDYGLVVGLIGASGYRFSSNEWDMPLSECWLSVECGTTHCLGTSGDVNADIYLSLAHKGE